MKRLTSREFYAIAIALLLLLIGLWLGWHFEPAWLSRFGALIIVVGIVFAVTELPVALERRARSIAKVTNALVFRSWLNQVEEEQHKTYTSSQRDVLWNEFEKLSAPDVDRQASVPRRRFLIVETVIVCIGTLTNGFGEWAVKLATFTPS